MEYKQVIEAL